MKDIFKEKLERVADDDLLIKALEYLFSKATKSHKPTALDYDDNKKLGEKYRAYVKSEEIIKQAFKNLMSYKVVRDRPEKFNKAI